MKQKVILAGAVLIGGSVAVAAVLRHRTPVAPVRGPVAEVQPDVTPAAPLTIDPAPVAEPIVVEPATPTKISVPTSAPVAVAAAVKPTAKPVQASKPNKVAAIPQPPHPAVPLGRAALSFVGMDPEAELIWGLTINDPTVPAHARKDLIEDLNEDGFPDPKHLTPDDLPLIVNRLELIEQMAPDSMDDTNAAAFMEAYKDLNNMLVKVAG